MPVTPLHESAFAMGILMILAEGTLFLWLFTNNKLTRKLSENIFLYGFVGFGTATFVAFVCGKPAAHVGGAFLIATAFNFAAAGGLVIIDNWLHRGEVPEQEQAKSDQPSS